MAGLLTKLISNRSKKSEIEKSNPENLSGRDTENLQSNYQSNDSKSVPSKIPPPKKPTCENQSCRNRIYVFDFFEGIWKCGKCHKSEIIELYKFGDPQIFEFPISEIRIASGPPKIDIPASSPIAPCRVPNCRNPLYWRDGYATWHCGSHDPPPAYSLAAEVIDVRDLPSNATAGVSGPQNGNFGSHHDGNHDGPRHPLIIGEDFPSETFWTNNLTFCIETRDPHLDGDAGRKVRESIEKEHQATQDKRNHFWMRSMAKTMAKSKSRI